MDSERFILGAAGYFSRKPWSLLDIFSFLDVYPLAENPDVVKVKLLRFCWEGDVNAMFEPGDLEKVDSL